MTGLFTKGVVNKDFYKINKKYNIEEKSVNLINKCANTILNKYEGFNKIKFINNDGDEYDFEIKGFSSQDYEIFVDNITFDSLEETKALSSIKLIINSIQKLNI